MGSIVMALVEKWDYGYAFYFAAEEIMGAGWVDVMPVTEAGQWFTLIYAFIGSILIYHALGDLATVPLAVRECKFESMVLGQFGDTLTEDRLQSLAKRAEDIVKPKKKQSGNIMVEEELVTSPGGGTHLVTKKKHKVTRDEFCLSMLLLLGRADMRHIR